MHNLHQHFFMTTCHSQYTIDYPMSNTNFAPRWNLQFYFMSCIKNFLLFPEKHDQICHCSVGGLILDFAVANYHGIAVFQPVINGK